MHHLDSSKPLSKPFNVAIVGGGIGGLCLAAGLLIEGVSVDIYESAPAFAEIGAGVALGTNAATAMALISPGVRAAFEKSVTYNASPEKKNTWFDFRIGQSIGDDRDIGKLICEVKSRDGQGYVHRAHYLDELVKLIPSTTAHFGKRLEVYEDQGENGVVLKFADGTTARHSILVGCDGIKSRTRQILLGKDNPLTYPQFSGKYVYRGLIPMDNAAQALGDALARDSQMYLGRGGHVLTFPVEQGRIMNVVAFQTKSDGWEDSVWVKPVDKQTIQNEFSQWGDSVKSIAAMVEKPEIWALFDHPPAETFTQGHVCLLGDAAHATTPHQGSGAGMAVEDALILSKLLGMVESSQDLKAALQIYDQVRRPRTQKVVTTSREAGLLYDMQLPGVGEDVALLGEQLKSRMDWVWNEDLEAVITECGDKLRAARHTSM